MSGSAFRIGVLTLSDKGARGEREDESGRVLGAMVAGLGTVARYAIIPDDAETIMAMLRGWSDVDRLDLILTTGGTGLSPRDVTPQATSRVIDYPVPGLAEAMRLHSLNKTPLAVLSRAVAGVRGQTLIINLPGSPRAVRENLEILLPVLPHALAKLAGDPADCGRV